jgi:hypothetical protein
MTSIDLDRLISGVSKYGAAAGASQSTIDAMREMLRTPLIARILSLSDDELHSVLMNDAYKIKMHQMYAKYFTGAAGALDKPNPQQPHQQHECTLSRL